MKRTNIYLPEPMRAKLRSISATTGLSVAELVRRACDHYIRSEQHRDFIKKRERTDHG